MSELTEYKELQRKALNLKDKQSEEYLRVADRMDVLWIRFSLDEQEEINQFWRELLIDQVNRN